MGISQKIRGIKALSGVLITAFLTGIVSVLFASPAYAATCTFTTTTPEVIVINDSVGTSTGGVNYKTRAKDYVYVGQGARWEYEVRGTGSYSNSSSPFKITIPSSSAGIKALNQTHSLSWTSNDGLTICTASVKVTGSAKVISAHDVNITYSVGSSYSFETETINLTFNVQNASGSIGDVPFGWLKFTFNNGYQSSITSSQTLIPIYNGTGKISLKFSGGTTAEAKLFKDRAFDVMAGNGYCVSSTCSYGYDSWWQGPKNVSAQKVYQFTGKNNIDPIEFTPNDPKKHKVKKGLTGQNPSAFTISSPKKDNSYAAAANNLALGGAVPSGVSLAGTASNSGQSSYFCSLLQNCAGKIGSAWNASTLNKIKACYEGDNPYTLKECIASASSTLEFYDGDNYSVYGTGWSATGTGQKALFIPAYNGIRWDTSVTSYVGPIVSIMHPGYVKVCESEATGLNWQWYDYGQALYTTSKYDSMRSITPKWRYNLAHPFYYYGNYAPSGYTTKLSDFSLTESVPTWGEDRWDISKPAFVNSGTGSISHYGGSGNGYYPNAGRNWGGGGINCMYDGVAQTQPKITFNLKLPESDGTTSINKRVYKDTMPLTIQELSVQLGTKKMFAPNIVFKIYENTGTYESPKQGKNMATVSGTNTKTIVQQITQCHKNGGDLKKNMCKDFRTTGALELPVNPATGKGEYIIRAYWAGDCDVNVPGRTTGFSFSSLSNKDNFGKCGTGGSFTRGETYFAYKETYSPMVSFTVVKEFQCLFEPVDTNKNGTVPASENTGAKNIWVTYTDAKGSSVVVKGNEVYQPYTYTAFDGKVVTVESTFTSAQRTTLSKGGTVIKNGATYKLDINNELAVVIMRSGDKLTLAYPAVTSADFIGIIDTPGVTNKIKTQTMLKDGSKPSENGEVQLYKVGSNAPYGRSGMLFDNIVELVGKALPAAQDWISFFWPSQQDPLTQKRYSVTVQRDVQVYGVAYVPNSEVPKLDWHICKDVPETEAITVISSQVNQ